MAQKAQKIGKQTSKRAVQDAPSLDDELFRAVRNGARHRAKEMLDAGADINARDSLGRNLLHAAVDHSAGSCIELLLIRGVATDVLAPENGMAPLHKAAWEGRKGIVHALLRHGADVNLQSRDGSTAMHYATSAAHDEVVMLLLQKRGDAFVADKYGDTPRDLAINSGQDALAQMIQEFVSNRHARRVKALRGRRQRGLAL